MGTSIFAKRLGQPIQVGCGFAIDRTSVIGHQLAKHLIGQYHLAFGIEYQQALGQGIECGADPLGHELYMRNCEPEVYQKARTLLEPLDYLGLRFTGRVAATPASMILSWLTDNRPGAKPAYVS